MPAILPATDDFNAVMPPGSIKFKHFTSHCTACLLCVSNCPGGVLRPAATEYGKRGFMQPLLDFDQGMCEYDCTVCSDVCPNGALVPLSMDKKHTLQIGIAHFKRHNCIVRIDHTHCGACAEHCPTGAVHMVPWGRGRGRGRHSKHAGLTIPQVEPELCIGCGACEHVCPATPKAITVTGLRKHDIAEQADDTPQTNQQDTKKFLF
jgi:ferredoxin